MADCFWRSILFRFSSRHSLSLAKVEFDRSLASHKIQIAKRIRSNQTLTNKKRLDPWQKIKKKKPNTNKQETAGSVAKEITKPIDGIRRKRNQER
jgi:hypothetical protein